MALLNSREVAALLHVHPKHIYRLLRRGLPGRRVGGEWRFVAEEVLAWSKGPNSGERMAADAQSAAAFGTIVPVIASNDDLVLDRALGLLAGATGPLLGRLRCDSGEAVPLLARQGVCAAGFHGSDPPVELAGRRLVHMRLFSREQGLVGRPGRGGLRLDDIGSLKFAGRPRTAGARLHLERALKKRGADPDRILRRARSYRSSGDVACAVARGEADLGICTRAWAIRVGLRFTPIVEEDYFLLVDSAAMSSEPLLRFGAFVQSPAFAALVRSVPGYDPAGAGTVKF